MNTYELKQLEDAHKDITFFMDALKGSERINSLSVALYLIEKAIREA